MSYCVNPACYRHNADESATCQHCGSSLILNDRYRVLRRLIHDDRRMTDVYEVIHLDLASTHILKVLTRTAPKLIELFHREAQVLEMLSHPNIPSVDIDGYFRYLPSGSTTALPCLIIEKIEGVSLLEWAASGRLLSAEMAVDWLQQMVEILHYLHGQNFIHRDIKPSNIILRPNGRLALIDFGAVRNCSSSTYQLKVSAPLIDGSLPVDSEITALVSPGYTPPEQILGRAVQQSDFFALGRTLVHLCTGLSPVHLISQTNPSLLDWYRYARHLDLPLVKYLDELMQPSVLKRPRSSEEILEFLRLRLPAQRRWSKLAKSGLFRLGCLFLTMLLLVSGFHFARRAFAERAFVTGLQQLNGNRLSEAQANFERSISLYPTEDAYINLGYLCERSQDTNCAKNSYSKAILLNPLSTAAYYNLGSLYEDQADYKSAIASYRKAVEVSHTKSPEPINNLARLLILQGKYIEAKSLVDSALNLKVSKQKTSRSILLKNLGWIYFKEKRYPQAKEILNRAIDLKFNLASSHCLLAQVLEAQKQPADAEWRFCLTIESEDTKNIEVVQWRSLLINRSLSPL
jgi:serine/threonine protein kinase